MLRVGGDDFIVVGCEIFQVSQINIIFFFFFFWVPLVILCKSDSYH